MSDTSKRIEDMKQRLEDVEEEIVEARADAEKVLPKHPTETFIESGTIDTKDVDNTIAPPG
jgi:hypothetical protein